MQKFNSSRAAEYEDQVRIALAGYEACHDLAACLLSAALPKNSSTKVLVVGAGGTAQEVVSLTKLRPDCRFMAVDPSQPMLDLSISKLEEKGLGHLVDIHLGYVDDLPEDELYDGATLMGVLHHLVGNEAKNEILRAISKRLKPGAPFILAGNQLTYNKHPLFLEAWGNRWRMHGSDSEEVKAKLGKILEGADPPSSPEVIRHLLLSHGFVEPVQFFSSLFWGAWICYKVS